MVISYEVMDNGDKFLDHSGGAPKTFSPLHIT